MRNLLLIGTLLALPACQTYPVEPRVLPAPLPEKADSLEYATLLARARTQASYANDALYVDKWKDVIEAAKGLEETAKFLPKATEVPKKHKLKLTVLSSDLGKHAAALRKAAADRKAKDATRAMQAINLQVREMRIGD